MMRPSGKPPTPRARSTAREPVESVSTFIFALLPSRMMEPSPNCLVMEERASSMFLSRPVADRVDSGADLVAVLAMGGWIIGLSLNCVIKDAETFAERSKRRAQKIQWAGGIPPALKALANQTARRIKTKLTA